MSIFKYIHRNKLILIITLTFISIISFASIMLVINANSKISFITVGNIDNAFGYTAGKYEIAEYNPLKVNMNDIYNFYKKNVQNTDEDVLKERNIDYLLLRDETNSKVGYYMEDGKIEYIEFDNMVWKKELKVWDYDKSTDTFKLVYDADN